MNRKVPQDRKILHWKFWNRLLDRALVGQFPSYVDTKGLPSIDFDLKTDEIYEKNIALVTEMEKIDDDRMPSFMVNFGPAFLPALAGAEFEYDQNTSWAHPKKFDSIEELKILDFNPSNSLWKKYAQKFLDLQKLNKKYMNGLCDMCGPFDILAGVVGSERLCIEIVENPLEVKRLAREAARFWKQVFEYHLLMLDDSSGTTDCFGLFCPARGSRWSEDFIALISPDAYEEFVLPVDIELAAFLNTSYIHVHSVALDKVDRILKNQSLKGVEISNDPNGPDMKEILKTASKVLNSGKSLMLSNWQVKITKESIEDILRTLPNNGLIITHEKIGK